YNVIGAHEEWSALGLVEARDRLTELLSEYQAFSGRRVTLVFDAQHVPGAGARLSEQRITVIYTKEHETADERVERLVKENKDPHRRIYVATSDYLEQRMILGLGAYRISSRELLEELRRMKGEVARRIDKEYRVKPTLGHGLDGEVLKTFEIWRRKK